MEIKHKPTIQFGKIYITKTIQKYVGYIIKDNHYYNNDKGDVVVNEDTVVIPIKTGAWQEGNETVVICLVKNRLLLYGFFERSFCEYNKLLDE